jgi:acetyl-CoA carboxylase biotin carboxyl carrier protein
MKNSKETSDVVNWNDLERLLKIMEDHGLEEYEYSRGDLRIRLRKPGAPPVIMQQGAAPSHAAAPAASASGSGSGAGGAAGASHAKADAAPAVDNSHIVKSPIVGTYYECPEPGKPAFVEVGDHVKSGQPLCIVEAMKLMNEIEADVAGKIVRAFMQNGQPVEYGQPLFAIQPDS